MNKKHNNINYECNINQTGKGVATYELLLIEQRTCSSFEPEIM